MFGYRGYNSLLGQYPTVKILIIANAAVFALMLFFPYLPWGLFALTPELAVKRFFLWQLFTHLFMHDGLWHLVFNMIALYFCGTILEHSWGARRFRFYYFFCGLSAALCSFPFYYHETVLGASGAIYGLFIACAVLYPEAPVYVYGILPMKLKHFVWLLIGLDILGILQASRGGVAHFAHLGGALFGYLYLVAVRSRSRFAIFSLRRIQELLQKHQERRRPHRTQKGRESVDEILDKISREGIDSLSPRERKILEEKSKH